MPRTVIPNKLIKKFIDICRDDAGKFTFRIIRIGYDPLKFGYDAGFPAPDKCLLECQIDEYAQLRLRRQWADELFVKAVKEGMSNEH